MAQLHLDYPFTVIPVHQLSERHFDEFPVWSEYYEPDEFEEIERWGVSRDRFWQLVKESMPGDFHCVYTLFESHPFPPRMRIFIRADLRTANGRALKGYIMNEDAWCLGVFHEGKEYFFSRHSSLDSLQREVGMKLADALGLSLDALFPIHYETGFPDADGLPIAGEFRIGRKSTHD